MDAAKAVTATFNQAASFVLTVSRAGDGTGTVTSTPAGVSCGADCSETYATGTVVNLTATPAAGSVFVSWSGACSGSTSCQVTVDGAKSVTATFALAMYSLTVTVGGTGGGTVTSSPAGVSCEPDCSESYNRGTVVSLTATPASGSTFGGWTGACSGTGGCQLTMTATRNVTATFNTGSTQIPPGDFDRDGRPDLLWRHRDLGTLYAWFLVNGKMTSGAYLQPDRTTQKSLQICALGDINGDSHTDLLWQDPRTGALTAWLMDGTRMVTSASIPSIRLPGTGTVSAAQGRQASWQVRGIADLNGDGHNDLVWHNPQTGELYVWFMNGTTPTSGASLSPDRFADTRWRLLGLDDFNGDGQADLLWQHRGTGDLYVWLMNGTQAVSAKYPTPSRFADRKWQFVRVSDFNGDGEPDFLWQHATSGDLYVWYMNGLTAVSAGYLDPIRPSDLGWSVAPR